MAASDRRNVALIVAISTAGGLLIIATTVVPTLILLESGQDTLDRWSLIGQAVAPIGVLYSGLALFAIIFTLLLQ